MRLLWLCNMMPGAVRAHSGGKAGSGLWTDHVLSDLRREDIAMHILCPGADVRGQLDESCSYAAFSEGKPQDYIPQLEVWMGRELDSFQPDVIHIWGTEYGHTLAMVNALEQRELLDRAVISIQGLCSVYAGHYAEGVPEKICRSYTLRDFLRQDNIRQQSEVFARRGKLEVEALKKCRHVIGRTDWDKACTYHIQPKAKYHKCCETLRQDFYEGAWKYETCRKHRVFASSCVYPIKGFHYLLEAMGQILPDYPDATLAVPGKSFLEGGLRQSSYQKYLAALAKKYGLEGHIEFLGSLSAEGMKEQYLKANAFVLPSTIENSPNSLGEAMLLGVPCVASHVGGVTTMMTHAEEGLIYQSTAPYMLAQYLRQIFEAGDRAEAMGRRAAAHAARTHDPEQNLQDLLAIYRELANL